MFVTLKTIVWKYYDSRSELGGGWPLKASPTVAEIGVLAVVGRRLRLIYEAVVNGVERQFEAVGDAELVENVV